MDVAFCLYTAIFIFSMDHARLVFRRCMCTLIVFLIFCNVFNWWIKYIRQQCEVFDTTSPLVISYLHFALLTYTWFFHPQAFCLDIGSIMTYILVVWIWVLQVLLNYANVCLLSTLQFCSLLYFRRSIAFGPAFSTPTHWSRVSSLAFSTPAFFLRCRVFRSRIYSRPRCSTIKTEDTGAFGRQRAKPGKIKARYSRPTCKNCSYYCAQTVFAARCDA